MAYSILDTVESQNHLLRVADVAHLLKISQKKVYSMVKAKGEMGIPSLNIAGQIRFDPKSLGYWLRKKDPTLAAAARTA